MYKVGVVGPKKSVQRILEVAEEFSSNLIFVPYIYQTAIETKQIIEQYNKVVDYFLFSGPIPYEIAKQTNEDATNFFYIHLLESGFYRALLQVITKTRKEIDCLSIDILDKSNIIDVTLDQLTVPINDMIVKTFSADIDYHKLYEYHYQLYKEQKVDAVLTCYPEVMDLLKKDNIPVEWISTTKLATRQVIKIIDQRAQISYFKRTQIGVCMITVDTRAYDGNQQLSYDIQLATLKMNEEFLLLSREMNGSFFTIGDGKYMIISSRGEIMDNLSLIDKTINRLTNSWQRHIKAGIGFGDSALKAELNARSAIYKTELKDSEIVIIDDLGKLIQVPFQHDSVLKMTSNNKEILNHLKDHQISIQSFERIRDVIQRKRKNQFTSNDLALELQMSSRNAQRLISSLKEAAIIEQIGEEKVAKKGRPRLLYKIKKAFL